MNWLTSLLKTNNMTGQMMRMMGMKRRNNRNGILISVLGLGLSAAAYQMMRGRNLNMRANNMMQPVQRIVQQMRNPIS